MPFFGGSWSQDDNGYIDYTGGTLNSWLGGSNEDEQRYAIEFNTALDQYNQQYALQKDSFQFQKEQAAIQNQLAQDTFNLNKQNLQFNQNLANRQQELSEKSYNEGVLNQARQMQMLGINPASAGGSISGMSMSGGSNVGGMPGAFAGSGASAGSPQSARAMAMSKYAAKKQMQMQMMASLMDYAQRKKELSIAQQNADTNRIVAETGQYNAETQRASQRSQSRVNESQIGLNSAYYAQVNSQTDYQRLINDDLKLSNDLLGSVGLSRATLESWRFIPWQTAAVLGVGGIVSGIAENIDSDADGELIDELVSGDVGSVVTVVEQYQESSDSFQNMIDEYAKKHPDVVISSDMMRQAKFWWNTQGEDVSAVHKLMDRYWR